MNLIERVKNILITPKKEWEVIANENDDHVKVLTSYLLLLALIPAVAAFIGWGFIGYKTLLIRVASVELGLRYALTQYISILAGTYLTALVFNELAPKYGAVKDFASAFRLSAYCYTAICVGGIFYLFPSLSSLASLTGLYALYLLYIGLKPMMKVPDQKASAYFVVSLLCMIAVSVVLSLIIGSIIGVGSAFRF